jgi:hypothetical protein
LKIPATNPGLSLDATCEPVEPPEELELAPPLEVCLAGEGATASPADPSEPPPDPPPGPPPIPLAAGTPWAAGIVAAMVAEVGDDVTCATSRTDCPDSAGDVVVAAGTAVNPAQARHTIAAPPDTAAVARTRDMTGVNTMLNSPYVTTGRSRWSRSLEAQGFDGA